MNRRIVLEFERPIVELESRLAEVRRFSQQNELDMEPGLRVLQEQLDKTRREVYSNLSPWQRVQLARLPDRPHTADYLQRIFTDFFELKGDRCYADDKALIGGFAKLDGQRVMVLGQQKGREVRESVQRNFGMSHPEGYRKALRLMQLAELAKVPLITFIDTPGAFPGVASEERHVGEAIAVNLREMFQLSIPIICIVIGEGGSGGALGIAVGNSVMVMENAYYSVITPEGCAAILWKASGEADKAKAAAALKLTAAELLKLQVIDEIIGEPLGGADKDPDTAAAMVKECLQRHLKLLQAKSPAELKRERYEKFRRMGQFRENAGGDSVVARLLATQAV